MVTETVHIATGKYDWLHALYEVPDPGKPMDLRPLVIMVHGFPGSHKAGHRDLYGDLEYQLIKNGFDTLRFDFRGCGESTGKSKDITFQTLRHDLNAAYDWAREKQYDTFFIVTEGLGSAIVLMEQPEELKALALLWPIINPIHSGLKQNIDEAAGANDEKPYITAGQTRIGKVFLKQLAGADLTKYIRNVKVPLLIQYGVKDEMAPSSQIDMFRENISKSPRIEITSYESGTHGLPKSNERKALYDQILQFLKKYT